MSQTSGSNPFTTPGTFTPVFSFEEGNGTIKTPKYDKDLKPNRPAFKDEKEVFQICTVAVAANKDRNERDAYVISKYEGDPPYDDVQRRTRGLGWQSNISAGLLLFVMGRVQPSFLRAINSTKYLTGQAIPDDQDKTVFYQEKITKFIRNWDGWQEFLSDIVFEDLLLGRGNCAWGDEYDWRPKFYNTSNFLLPEGCPQNVDKLPWIIRLDTFLLHEFISKIKDPDSASAAGWDIDNCVKALNEATQQQERKDRPREIQDWLSDGAYSSTYTQTLPLTVKTFTVLAMEPDSDGKISEWVIRQSDGLLLYKKENKYDRMSDAAQMLCYTRTTSGTAHGSKGLGRILLNIHQVYDRAVNKLIDDSYLASMRVAEMPANKRVNFSFKVQAPFLITPEGYSSQPSNMSVNTEAFYALVRQVQSMGDQTAGAYTPSSIIPQNSSDKSATQSAIDAQKDAEIKEGVMSRFLSQFNGIIFSMTRRILNQETYDEDAKKLQQELLDYGITKEQIEELRNGNPFSSIADYSSSARNSKILQFFNSIGHGNPAFDQMKMLKDVAAAIVDNDYANEVFLPTANPDNNDVAVNQQMTEFASMVASGLPIKPSPTDDDMTHMATIVKEVQAMIQQQPFQDKQKLTGMKMVIAHMGMHLEAAKAKGGKPADLKQFEQFAQQMVKTITDYENRMVTAGQRLTGQLPPEQQQQAAALPEANPANSEGGLIGVPQAGPPGGVATSTGIIGGAGAPQQ